MRLINIVPSRGLRVGLTALPFLLLLVIYMISAEARLALNPDDKLLPSFGQMADAIQRIRFRLSNRACERRLHGHFNQSTTHRR